ncbi:MAG: hypothetical protein ACRD2E_14540 [Terriglobales bacterium]
MKGPANAPPKAAFVAEVACPVCGALVSTQAARCGRCQYLLQAPPLLPLPRRPGARAALLAGLLGALGAVTYGVTAWVGVALALGTLARLREPERRRSAPGVPLLARSALAISLAGAVAGAWGLYGRWLRPHWQGIHDWERRQTVRNTFRVLNAAEMTYSRLHPAQGYSANLEQLATGPDRLGLSRRLTIGPFRLHHFGYEFLYRPIPGDPVRGYRLSASPLPPGRGPCFQSGPLGLVRRHPCSPRAP